MNKNEKILIDIMYREMYRKLCIYAVRQLEDENLAEEAVQETFRIACEKDRQVIESENPRGWIMQTLKYNILNIKRERKYLSKLYNTLVADVKPQGLIEENVDVMYSDLISEEDFEILKMIVIGNCTIKEAAEKYGLSLSLCKKKIKSIKQKLKAVLDEQEGSECDD